MSLRPFIVASMILATVACTDAGQFDRRVNSPDEIYVSDLARELDAAGVDFRALRDGSIAYRSRDEKAFKAIEERVKKNAAERAVSKK